MPRKHYELQCGCGTWPGVTQTTLDSTCPRCGQPGRYLGYKLSRSDAMAAFCLATGLPPMGPERESPMGQSIVARLVRCPACSGEMICQDLESQTWAWCPLCGGQGAALDGKFDEVTGFPAQAEGPLVIGLNDGQVGDSDVREGEAWKGAGVDWFDRAVEPPVCLRCQVTAVPMRGEGGEMEQVCPECGISAGGIS